MRVLVLLLALLSMPVLAADYDYTPWPDDEQATSCQQLAQAQMPSGQIPSGQMPGSTGGQSGGQSGGAGGSSGGGQSPSGSQPQRYPGDFCCKHCRHNELPCGDTCIAKTSSKAVCQAKRTCACPGKP